MVALPIAVSTGACGQRWSSSSPSVLQVSTFATDRITLAPERVDVKCFLPVRCGPKQALRAVILALRTPKRMPAQASFFRTLIQFPASFDQA